MLIDFCLLPSFCLMIYFVLCCGFRWEQFWSFKWSVWCGNDADWRLSNSAASENFLLKQNLHEKFTDKYTVLWVLSYANSHVTPTVIKIDKLSVHQKVLSCLSPPWADCPHWGYRRSIFPHPPYTCNHRIGTHLHNAVLRFAFITLRTRWMFFLCWINLRMNIYDLFILLLTGTRVCAHIHPHSPRMNCSAWSCFPTGGLYV